LTIIGVTMAKNEADIIESFVRHNLRYVSRLHILDHDSSDATGDILRSLQDEGLPLTVHRADDPGYRQSSLTGDLVRAACEEGADFVLPLDADEFIRSSVPEDLEAIVGQLPRDYVGVVRWKSYVPTRHDDPSIVDPARRIVHRLEHEPLDIPKCLLPGTLLRTLDWQIPPGNHTFTVKGAQGEWVPWQKMALLKPLSLCHYPIRSETQLIQKIVLGWFSLLQTPNRDRNFGYHWYEIYRDIVERGTLPENYATLRAMNYTTGGELQSRALLADPLPITHSLCYTQAEPASPLSLILKWLDRHGLPPAGGAHG
jgi:hypothetical protein